MELTCEQWLDNLKRLRRLNLGSEVEPLALTGLLAHFPRICPIHSQDWVNSVIRSGSETEVYAAITRCEVYIKDPNAKFWIKRENLNGDIVEESSIFRMDSFLAINKAQAELFARHQLT